MPRIKQESGRVRSMATPDSIPDAPSETASERVQRRRPVRSAAPSIETCVRPTTASSPPNGPEDEDDDLVMLEFRRGPKSEHELNPLGPQSVQSSFAGANRALRCMGQKLKDINDALGELQARGIQHVASLPELVLVGDQSSGKSSLMSAIAGLSLPRSSGTCTRCPIHICVSRADEWSCRVFLKQDYDFCPPNHPLTERDVTGNNKFPPWAKLDPSRQARRKFKTVRDQFDSEEIETVLRCAQVAILNPSTHYQFFIPKLKGEASDNTREQHLEQVKKKEERSEAQFSPNTVALEVKGPDLADLNFYDLPGVFMTTRRSEDIFLERVVQNLTREYISRPSAIILCAVPMNQDTENSLALKIIRGQRAQNRCIGVMTKADLLPRDDHAASGWLGMLNGEAHQTGFGYFITSRQGSDLDEQNKMEERFFNRTADATGHWPEVFDHFKEKCGVEKLKVFLSEKLGEEFAKTLPEVREKVDIRLADISKQLKKYPDPPPNPELEIMKRLAEFTIRVKDRVMHQDFMSSWNDSYGGPFKALILNMKPKFNVREHAKVSKPSPVVIDLDGDSPTPSPTVRKRPAPAMDLTRASNPKRQRRVNAVVKTEARDNHMFPSTPRHTRSATPAMTSSRGGRSRSLMDIRHLIRRAAVPGQPGLVSASVYEPLFTEAAKSWDRHLHKFVDNTLALLQSEIFTILDAAFAHLTNRAVYRESREHMRAFIEAHRTELRAQLDFIYNLESKRLFTKDEGALKRNQAAEKQILVRHRNHFRIAAYNGEELCAVPKMEDMTDEDRKQEESKMVNELKNLGPDPFEPELAVAAYIRGYYLTAANRFVDYVSIHVMSGLLPRVASVIEMYLHEKLGLTSSSTAPDVLERLMSEGPEIEQKRRDLRAEKETLDGAMDIIVNLERHAHEQQLAAAAAAASQSQYTNGFDASQDSMGTLGVGHANGIADRATVYSATQFGDA